ncbi:hypothetical protein HGRIS_010769 [Hohenbuehelia grisea]|uniref:DUF6535 domain-containing protein n=1 Tax=Hohenbuehelia grisea TaxID=104357 RepID=A0ABR3IXY5_9AGAR
MDPGYIAAMANLSPPEVRFEQPGTTNGSKDETSSNSTPNPTHGRARQRKSSSVPAGTAQDEPKTDNPSDPTFDAWAHPQPPDNGNFAESDLRSRFWSTYKEETDRHDDDFVKKHNENLDIVLIFAGLFSAVNTTFIQGMLDDLSPDPNDATQALLRLVVHTLNNSVFPDETPEISPWDGPSSTIVWTQCVLYASLAASLLAAFGAVLGKQWLGYYARVGAQGSTEAQCAARRKKTIRDREVAFSRGDRRPPTPPAGLSTPLRYRHSLRHLGSPTGYCLGHYWLRRLWCHLLHRHHLRLLSVLILPIPNTTGGDHGCSWKRLRHGWQIEFLTTSTP